MRLSEHGQEIAIYRSQLPMGSACQQRRKGSAIDVHRSFLVATMLDHEGNNETGRVHPDIESFLELPEWVLSENSYPVADE
jgi:hypothetical protein